MSKCLHKQCLRMHGSRVRLTVYYADGTQAGCVELDHTVCEEHQQSLVDFVGEQMTPILCAAAAKLGLPLSLLERRLRIDVASQPH